MPQFLIIYNQQTGAVAVTSYTDDQRAVARERRFELNKSIASSPISRSCC